MEDRKKIGAFLISIKAMTEAQVDEVLALQAAGDSRVFGEIAIERRLIDDESLKRYIEYADLIKTLDEA